jgi:hypothetical protein
VQGAAVLCGGQVVRHYAPGQSAVLVSDLLVAMNHLCAEVGGYEPLLPAWTANAARCIDRVTGAAG